MFGSTTAFGVANKAAGMTGTVVKFSPVTGTDTMMKNGVTQTISTRHNCITCMKEYESKSLEELRFEDYQAGRKGTQNQSTGLFGTQTQPSLFGAPTGGTSAATPSFGSTTGGFGTTNQPGGTGLFNKPIAGFGAPTTTTSAFAFNSTNPPNLFGANTQAKPFGATAPAPLFSTTSTAPTAGTGFGTTQNTGFGSFGTTQPNQSIGLFNQNKSAFSLPASSTTTGFGGFGQPATTNTGTSFFGAKPAGTTGFGTSTFGATTAPSFGSNLGFGTIQNTNNSLFNSSFKPIGQNTGFSFGSSTNTTGLGTNTGLNLSGGTSLFNQQKPTGMFGSSTGTFNNTSFGTSTGFGTNTGTMPSLGMNMMGGIGMNQVPQNNSIAIHEQILALVSSPYGDSPLLKNLLPASGKAEELLKLANTTNRAINNSKYKVNTNSSPRIHARVATSAHVSKKSLFEGLEEEDPSLIEAFQPRPNAKRLVLRPKPTTNISHSAENSNSPVNNNLDRSLKPNKETESTNKENQASKSSSSDGKSASWLKSTSQKNSAEKVFDGQQSPFQSTDIPPEGIVNTITDLRTNIESQSSLSFSLNISSNTDKNSLDSTERDSDSPQELDETPCSSLRSGGIAKLAQVTLRRVGYYTIPPLDKLDDYVCGKACIVPNFTVGRKGYGNVYFPDSFDVYGLNLDDIVHFRHKEVIIYPDDDKKPPVGQGLNRRAQVTLDRVWPQDKSRHEPITDPHRLQEMNYEGKLRRVSAKYDTRFLEYRAETGSWVFKVDHFSKYGLSDSDDEDDKVSVENLEAKNSKILVKREFSKNMKIDYPDVRPADFRSDLFKDCMNGFKHIFKVKPKRKKEINSGKRGLFIKVLVNPIYRKNNTHRFGSHRKIYATAHRRHIYEYF